LIDDFDVDDEPSEITIEAHPNRHSEIELQGVLANLKTQTREAPAYNLMETPVVGLPQPAMAGNIYYHFGTPFSLQSR
jgi:hypothetical protein